MKQVLMTVLLFGLSVMVLQSCEEDTTNSKIGPLYMIEVTPPAAKITIDSTLQFTAVAKDVDLNVLPDLIFIWESEKPNVASIDENGLLIGIGADTTTISASVGDIESLAVIVIVDSLAVTDFDGNVYSTVQIGDQIWTAENWKCTHTADGTILNGAHTYDNNDIYLEEYGRLYTWEAANEASPPGWHLPSNNEWQVLINAVGSNPVDKLREGGSSGLDIKLGGRRTDSGSFGYVGQIGVYWTATQSDATHATVKLFALGEMNVITDNTPMAGETSVRYIKNSN